VPSSLGLDPEKFRWAKDYSHVEIPWSGKFYNPIQDMDTDKARKGQTLHIIPATNITNHDGKAKLLVVVNPTIHLLASVPSVFLLEQAAKDVILIPATFRVDTEELQLQYLVRLYALA
jgi:hypothetical protein